MLGNTVLSWQIILGGRMHTISLKIQPGGDEGEFLGRNFCMEQCDSVAREYIAC